MKLEFRSKKLEVRDIVVTIFVRCMCARPCVRPDLSGS